MSKIKLYYDWQGWPVSIMSLKDILIHLGFEEHDGKLSISADNELLNCYPRLLENDGMGYGINERFITEVDTDTYNIDVNGIEVKLDIDTKKYDANQTKNNINIFNIFYDKEAPEEYLKKMVDDYLA